MDRKQKEGKAANKRPKRMKVQPKRWPKKRVVQKGEKWGKVDSKLREGMAAKRRPKRLQQVNMAAN